MSRPFFYIDRYTRDGFAKAVQRLIPTAVGSHVRAAFHGVGDGSRSLEVYVQPNGWWSVETGPGPVSCGKRTPLASGRLPGEWGGESFGLQRAARDTYASREITRVISDGPAPDEDFYRLRVSGESQSHHVNVTARVLDGLATLIEMDERGELS